MLCGFSSVDRALPCQGRGREFESLNPHQAIETRIEPRLLCLVTT